MARKQCKNQTSRKARKSRKAKRAKRTKGASTNVESLRKAYQWLLPEASIFAKVRFHGNVSWTASSLVLLALCWSWSEARHVTDAFTEAAGWCQSLLGGSPLTTRGNSQGSRL